jgi:hypothetical protein
VALATLGLNSSGNALTRAPVTSAITTPNPVSSSWPVAAAFNGGRSQVNFNFMQFGGEFPFLNCFKTAQNWGFRDNSGMPLPSTLDSDGYPLSISNGGVYAVFFVPSQTERPGNYVITWSGNGTIICLNGSAVSGNLTSSTGSGRYVFSTTDTRLVVGISAIGNPRISNLQVFHVNDEAALNAGQVFGVKFKQRLAEANFGVLRFLNWQSGNTTMVTTWATRKPLTYVFYQGHEYRANLYAGVTSLAGTSYSVGAPPSWSGLVDKATVIIRFGQGINSACTLNVGGSGSINILSDYGTALSSGWNNFPVAGVFATLVYDATLKAWLKQGGDVAFGNIGIDSGCPPELMVRLCAEVGAHPYFVTPALAIDPATDYMPSLAQYCRDNGPPWMIPRFEGPNETWNYAGGFHSTYYGDAKGLAYGWGASAHHDWYGKVMSVLGQIVSNVFAADRKRYQVLCGVQTVLGINSSSTASCDPRLSSAQYVSQAAPAQFPYSKSPAYKWVTHVCCAQYYVPSEYNTPKEATDAAAYASASPSQQLAIATAYAGTVITTNVDLTLPQCALYYAGWKAWAQRFGIRAMCGYEGGYSPDYSSNGTGPVDILRGASKLAPPLSTYTTTNYKNFVGLTDTNFTAEFPSCFQLAGGSPSNNAWSVLEDVYQTPNPPQWNAIVAFNH